MYIVGAILAPLALVVALLAIFRPFHDLRRVRVAFGLLEDEFEELRAEVKSALGRIYRLKAAKVDGSAATPEAEEKGTSETGTDSASGLTPRQLKIQNEILARRRRV